jgi:GTP-dependent phosphoenolpyruvate carboxykinase
LANVKKVFSSETAWPNGATLDRKHLCKILYKTTSFGSIRPTNMNRCFLSSVAPFGQAVSEEKTFLTLANQKQVLPLVAIFVGGMGRNEETLNLTG